MGYEVDVLGVGGESKSGDAIALRWGNLYGSREEQKVVVIDGGFGSLDRMSQLTSSAFMELQRSMRSSLRIPTRTTLVVYMLYWTNYMYDSSGYTSRGNTTTGWRTDLRTVA